MIQAFWQQYTLMCHFRSGTKCGGVPNTGSGLECTIHVYRKNINTQFTTACLNTKITDPNYLIIGDYALKMAEQMLEIYKDV